TATTACSGKLKPTRRVNAEHWWCDTANESPWKGALASRRWSSSSSMVRTHRVVFAWWEWRARDREWDVEGPWSLMGCGGVCNRGSAMMSVMQTIWVYSFDPSPLARLYSSRAAMSYLFRGEH
ncbi:hypothetical protein PAXINDRAFT_166746, partial [Paxillus involutus ATCC 200175]